MFKLHSVQIKKWISKNNVKNKQICYERSNLTRCSNVFALECNWINIWTDACHFHWSKHFIFYFFFCRRFQCGCLLRWHWLECLFLKQWQTIWQTNERKAKADKKNRDKNASNTPLLCKYSIKIVYLIFFLLSVLSRTNFRYS